MRLKEDINKLRGLLLKGQKSWGELMELTHWSPSVLKNRVDFLIGLGEVVAVLGQRKGRRTSLYTVADGRRSEAERARYYAVNYINKMAKLVHCVKQSKDKKSSISAFISPVEKEHRKFAQIMVDGIVGGYVNLMRLVGKGLQPGQKLAIVITREG